MMYGTIAEDLGRVMTLCATGPTPASIDVKFFIQLFEQTCIMIGIRQRMINMYAYDRNLLVFFLRSSSHFAPKWKSYRVIANTSVPLDVTASINLLEVLLEDNRRSFFHPYFALLRHTFTYRPIVCSGSSLDCDRWP